MSGFPVWEHYIKRHKNPFYQSSGSKQGLHLVGHLFSSSSPESPLLFAAGVTVHSASLSSSSSTFVSSGFTSFKRLESLVGGRGGYFVLSLNLSGSEPVVEFAHVALVSFCFVLFCQWLDCSSNWSEHQYPGGHHHAADCSSVHCSVCGLAHNVQKGDTRALSFQSATHRTVQMF